MSSYKNLILGFASIILLSTMLSFTSIYKMLDLAELTEKMYKHPFTVSNAIANIETESVKIQHKMQIMINMKNISKIHNLARDIEICNTRVNTLYSLIFQRYLGDINDIKKSHNAFLKLKGIREGIVNYLIDNQHAKARIAREEEMLNVKKFNNLILTLKDFANNKATTYNNNAKIEKSNTTIVIVALLLVIATISISIAFLIIKNIIESSKETNRHFHLIEQNVNLATLNIDTSIKDVSASLARLFNLSKKDLINHDGNLLFGNDQEQIDEINRIIETSKAWNGDIYIKNVAWINADIQPILNSDYELSGYSMIVYDITSKKQLELISVTDGMTGLYNRREFDKTFYKRLKLARREQVNLVFMMLDIDFFKLYNDNYGHQHGDMALKSVAMALKNVFCRPDDAVYRLGGEEFGVLFSANDINGVEQISQKVLDAVKELNIEHKYSNVSDHITISIGAGLITNNNIQNVDDIYAEVDGILYEAKDNGRDRYEILSI